MAGCRATARGAAALPPAFPAAPPRAALRCVARTAAAMSSAVMVEARRGLRSAVMNAEELGASLANCTTALGWLHSTWLFRPSQRTTSVTARLLGSAAASSACSRKT